MKHRTSTHIIASLAMLGAAVGTTNARADGFS